MKNEKKKKVIWDLHYIIIEVIAYTVPKLELIRIK